MKIMTNNYFEETDRCLFRENIQKCIGEAKEICKPLNKNIWDPFPDSGRVLIKHNLVM